MELGQLFDEVLANLRNGQNAIGKAADDMLISYLSFPSAKENQVYIVCKQQENGALVTGTPPRVHHSFEVAKAEAERLTSNEPSAAAFFVFKAVSVTKRAPYPVETKPL